MPKSFWKTVNLHEIGVFLLLALVTWGARFSSSNHFALYYEDWGRIPSAMTWKWSDWLEYMAQVPGWLINFKYEGRALHPAGIHTFAFIGQQLGGLSVIYRIGYGIAALNTFLYYLLLKRISKTPLFALFGALAFALFPAHTSQAFLTITLGILPALTLVLIAFHLYLDGRKLSVIASYGLVFISILYYEKFLLLFCVAPLLKKEWNRKSWREWIRHCGIIFLILVLVVIGRKINGEGRVSNLELSSFFNPLFSMLAGPIIAMNTFLERPFQVLTSLQNGWLIPLSLFFLAIAYVIYQSLSLNNQTKADSKKSDHKKSGNSIEQSIDPNLSAKHPEASMVSGNPTINPPHLIRLTIAGLLMLILSYALNFIDPPNITEGRTSFVHAAAVVGASMLWACGCSYLVGLRVFAHQKIGVVGLGSAYFTLLIAFGFFVQQDYVLAAQYQRSFLTQIIKLCPDMTEGTVILAEPNIFIDASTIGSIEPLNGGSFPGSLGYLYKFPDAWRNDGAIWEERANLMKSSQPKLYFLKQGWEKSIVSKASKDGTVPFNLSRHTLIHRRLAGLKVNSSNVILIGSKEGQLFRKSEPLTLKGKSFPLKQNDSNLELPPFEKGVLYDDLIDPNLIAKVASAGTD